MRARCIVGIPWPWYRRRRENTGACVDKWLPDPPFLPETAGRRMLPARAGRAVLGILSVVLMIWGCAYRGRDDALSQRFTWFSYMNGDDIRAACVPGAIDRYRFVYNAVYTKQARTYDFRPNPNGDGWRLKARVLGPADLSSVSISPSAVIEDPLDLLAPFAGRKSMLTLSGRDIDVLDERLAQSGFFQPAPKGLSLYSEDFFWIGVACVNGRLIFNAWKYPSAGFEALTFPPLLFSWDETGVAVNPPRRLTNFDIYGEASPKDEYVRFSLKVGENGLAGAGTLF